MIKRSFADETSGVALIELALVCPLLIALLLGAAEYGRMCYVGMEVTNAAHAGVQYGTQNRVYASDNSTIRTVALNEESNIINMNVPSPLDTTSITVTQLCAATYSDAPTSANCASLTTNAVEYVQVNTTVTVASLFHPYGFNGNHTLTGKAIARVRGK